VAAGMRALRAMSLRLKARMIPREGADYDESFERPPSPRDAAAGGPTFATPCSLFRYAKISDGVRSSLLKTVSRRVHYCFGLRRQVRMRNGPRGQPA